jgi:ribosomal protein S19
MLNKHIIKITEQICMRLEEHTELMENMRNINSFQLGILNGRCHVGNKITDESIGFNLEKWRVTAWV